MRIDYLADHKDLVPAIAKWFFGEWSCFYPGKRLKDFEAMVFERVNRDRLPLALVAMEGTELLGIGCLKAKDMETRPELTPWLAGMYVARERRGRGIGAALVRAVEENAARLGIAKLYLHTPGSARFYARLGWRVREKTEYCGCGVTIMEKELPALKGPGRE